MKLILEEKKKKLNVFARKHPYILESVITSNVLSEKDKKRVINKLILFKIKENKKI